MRQQQWHESKAEMISAADGKWFQDYMLGYYDWDRIQRIHKALIDANKKISEYEEIIENNSQWISVDERLPETEQKCLLAVEAEWGGLSDYFAHPKETEVFIGWLDMIERTIGNWYLQLIGNQYLAGTGHKVTHWMPLPEPPIK